MKKAVIHYFSGTGNTQHAIRIIEANLVEMGYQVAVNNIENKENKSEENQELHVFAYPVYGLGTPAIMVNYIKGLKTPAPGSKAAVISVGGHNGKVDGYEGQSLAHVSGVLKRKGFHVFFTKLVSYPENWTQLIPTLDEKTMEGIFKKADEHVARIAKKIGGQEELCVKRSKAAILLSWICYGAYTLIGRRILGKVYIADRQCTSCGICAEKCPVSCIRMSQGKPSWNWNCEGCQRCINACPQKSIQTSVARLALLLAVQIAPIVILVKAGKYMGFSGFFGVLLNILLYCVGGILFSYLIDRILYFLEQIPVVRKAFEYSYTKNYARYRIPVFFTSSPTMERRNSEST